MATSGETSYNPVRDIVIRGALRKVGAYASTDNPRPEQISDAQETLNMMLKSWQVEGFLWLKTFATLFLNKGQTSYQLTNSTVSGFAHCATSYIETTLAVAAVAGDGTLTLTDAAEMADGDFVGIVSDIGQIEWYYASFVGNVATLFSDSTLFIAATVTSAASIGNVAYSHTVASQIYRPTRVFLATRKLASGAEIPITLISRQEYSERTNKTVVSKVVEAFYDPQMVSGILYVWPTSDTAAEKLVLTVDRPLQVLLTDENTYDFPEEWMECIIYGLASRLAAEYGVSTSERQLLVQEYTGLKQHIIDYDREPTSSFLQMDRS